MALVNCRKCVAKISTEAKTCTHCGCNDPVPPKCIKCEGWIYDGSSSCPNCGDPNPLQARETGDSSDTSADSGSTVKCRKCGKTVSLNAKACPHCNCTEPAPGECQACGSDVDYEKDICSECGHPLNFSKGEGKLVICRKCGNKTSTGAKGCPKCNCIDPYIEPLPFVKCREDECGSIVHKEAKQCQNCGCPDPTPRDESIPKSSDYARAHFLVKLESVDEPRCLKTKDIILFIHRGVILPQQKITIDVPSEFQLWRPAYYYTPFSEYENFDAAAEKAEAAAKRAASEKAAIEKAASEKAAADEAAAEKAAIEKKFNNKLLLGILPVLLLTGPGVVINLVHIIFYAPQEWPEFLAHYPEETKIPESGSVGERALRELVSRIQFWKVFEIFGGTIIFYMAARAFRYRNALTAKLLIVFYAIIEAILIFYYGALNSGLGVFLLICTGIAIMSLFYFLIVLREEDYYYDTETDKH